MLYRKGEKMRWEDRKTENKSEFWWTDESLQILKDMAGIKPPKVIAGIIGTTQASVYNKAKRENINLKRQ